MTSAPRIARLPGFSSWSGALFRRGFRAGGSLSAGVEERGIERCRQLVGLPAVGESRNEEFVAETLRMASASQKHEQASHFSFGTDNYLPCQNKGRHNRAVKLSAVAIHARIDGIQHSYLQDRSFGQGV